MTNFIVKNVNEASRIASLCMTRGDKYIVRISGGCGHMESTEEARLLSFATAFVGYKGVIIGGGTRMFYRNNLHQIRPGVTELLPAIKKIAPACTTVGITPKVKGKDLELIQIPGSPFPLLCFGQYEEYITTFTVENDFHIMVQETADLGARWDAEYRTALIEMEVLRQEKQYRCATIFYNGGKTSEKELMDTLELGWPVILIKNSGRMCDTYGNDPSFLERYPHLHVVATPQQLQEILFFLN